MNADKKETEAQRKHRIEGEALFGRTLAMENSARVLLGEAYKSSDEKTVWTMQAVLKECERTRTVLKANGIDLEGIEQEAVERMEDELFLTQRRRDAKAQGEKP